MKDQRQGDVNLFKATNIPKDLVEIKPDKNGKTILVEGEATGHAHAFYTNTPIFLHKESGRRFVLLPGGKDNTALMEEWERDYQFHLGRSKSEKYTELCRAHYKALREDIELLDDPGSYALLRHEEHWGLLVPSGTEIVRQYEEDWAGEMRRVMD